MHIIDYTKGGSPMPLYNLYNRRPYTNREQPERNTIIQSHEDIGNYKAELNAIIQDILKRIHKDIDEVKQYIKRVEEKIYKLESRQVKLENQLEEEDPVRRLSQSDLSSLRSEIEVLKREAAVMESKSNHTQMSLESEVNPITSNTYQGDKPVMPGSGFSYITADFLKNMNKKQTE